MDYKKVMLNTLCDINIGKTPARKEKSYWKEGTNKWISIADLTKNGRYIFETKESITNYGVKKSNIKIIPKDTVIMSFKLSIGKVAITGEEMYSNEAIASFPIKDEKILNGDYLYYVLQTLRLEENTDRAVMGATLNKSKLNLLEIPLPSIDIQIKIANVLDKSQELINDRKAQIEKYDKLLQSVFLDMFGDPVINPKGWKKEIVKKFADVITGNTPPRKEKDNYGEYIEWIKSDNINTPHSYLTEASEWLSEKGALKGRIVDKNSILMTCIAGSLSCIGNLAITNRKVAFNQQINGLVPKKSINIFYLYRLMIEAKKYIQDSSTGGMKGMVSKGTLSELKFILPPIELQNQFAEIVEKVETEKKKMEESLVELENNFNSIMQRAFKGELF